MILNIILFFYLFLVLWVFNSYYLKITVMFVIFEWAHRGIESWVIFGCLRYLLKHKKRGNVVEKKEENGGIDLQNNIRFCSLIVFLSIFYLKIY
jgi:hypothetical protein